jgi:16S rRNA (guanine527-N7)-methyltransferase
MFDPEPAGQAQASEGVLCDGARSFGFDLTTEQQTKFAAYSRELVDWNQRVNLTSIVEPTDIQVKHFLDSLSIGLALPRGVRSGEVIANLLDVGAGAGFPGVPLAIVLTNLHVTLLEATQKKCRFLENLITTLGVPNVRVVAGRAEEVAHLPAERAHYDIVVARALAPLPTLAELCLPFARLGGRVIAPKKTGIADELVAARRAIDLLGGKLLQPVAVRLPGEPEARQLILVEKVKPTPQQYPRRPGLPAKNPLLG